MTATICIDHTVHLCFWRDLIRKLCTKPALKFNFELEVGEIALEICKIQRAPLADRVPGNLRRECRGQHHLAGELDVQCRADVQSIADEGLHAKSVKSPVILQLTAQRHFGSNSIGYRRRHAEPGALP